MIYVCILYTVDRYIIYITTVYSTVHIYIYVICTMASYFLLIMHDEYFLIVVDTILYIILIISTYQNNPKHGRENLCWSSWVHDQFMGPCHERRLGQHRRERSVERGACFLLESVWGDIENAGSEKHDMFMPLQPRGKYIYIYTHLSVTSLLKKPRGSGRQPTLLINTFKNVPTHAHNVP